MPEAHVEREPRRRTRVLFFVVYFAVLALLFEGTARLWSAVSTAVSRWRAERSAASPPSAGELEAIARRLDLDAYEMADPVHRGRWRLRPGYRATVSEMLEQKRAAGRVLAVRYIEQQAPLLGMGRDDLAMEVNADGYRGPALDAAHGQVRILTLGDSCTFGSPLSQWHGYPRALERELRGRGLAVEVVNGGVEGYAPADVLARIEEFRALRPEITTLYVGWNALYTERFFEDNAGLRRYLASARLAGRAFDLARARSGGRQAAVAAFERPKRPDREAKELRQLDGYTPAFLPDVVRILDAMSASGSRLVIITLPGIYSTRREPSPRVLEIGHLPTFTDNPFVLARMAERYNDALRELAARKGLTLVDFARWSDDELQPPEQHFVDSVHLDERSQSRVGALLADRLQALVLDATRT